MKFLSKISGIFAIYLLATFPVKGQIPTHIDPLQKEEPVNIFERPEFIIPILAIFVLLIGYYRWQKRKKK